MSRKITTIIYFKIKSTFEEWAKIFDSKELKPRYSEFYNNLLLSGFSKENFEKVIFIHQPLEGNIQKFGQANSEFTKSHKVDFLNMEESTSI